MDKECFTFARETVYGAMPPPTKRMGKCWKCCGLQTYARDVDDNAFAIKCPICSGLGTLVYEVREA